MLRRLALVLGLFVLFPAAAHSPTHTRLPVQTITIDDKNGAHRFEVEIAADDASRARGLMHRTYLAPDAGMLFDFRTPLMTAFWMKDTPLPLDILFVRGDGTISSVAADAVPESTAEIASVEPVRVVIEINAGQAHRLGIVPGDTVHGYAFDNKQRRRR